MRQQYKFVCLMLLFISGYEAQDPSTTVEPHSDWYGDPSICQINEPTTPSPLPPPALPKFTNQAEFTLELVIHRQREGSPESNGLSLFHYMYDYDNNTLTVIESRNGTIDVRFYEYDILKRSIYNRDTCVASNISTYNSVDGRSAIQIENGTWHIRPVNEFLLFSSDEPGREVKATYIGQDVVRGIRVDKWRTCHIDRTRLITEKRIWSFAQRGVSMPSGVVSDLGVPIQAIINGSVLYENYTKRFEFDEVFNVLSYRPSLTELINRITPTRGVFCDGVQQDQLVSLTDVGINWPFRFNVRVEASTSRSVEWQRFHLYYHRGDDDSSSRLRYDYLPQGSEDYQSVIHDYTDNLTYTIDRRIGTCKINRGVEVPDVNPLIDPIRFFIKNEAIFIYRPPEKAWENKRTRLCRTGSVQCTVLTTQADNFPNIIEPDTGLPSGETWNKTAIEYSWAMRAPDRSPTNRTRRLDYPVSLYLKMYRYQDSSLLNVNTEDVEYEFYEMSYDENLNQFDVSLCYRSLNYEYLHLGFILDIDGESKTIDRNNLNRFQLERDVHYNLINRMQIRYSRITDLEIDHESTDRYISVYFTLLGRTPNPESESGFYDDEPTAEEARDILKQVIDDEQFEFDMTLRDGSQIRFRASTKSLSTSKQFMNTHVFGKQITLQSYTSISLGLAIGVGLLAGLVAGILVAAVIRIVRKKPMPSLPSTITNPLPTINFRSEKTTKTTSDA